MLLTKLHLPSTVNHLVSRSSLHQKLDMGLNRKLILVSAQAGFGKTTLVSDWIKQKGIDAAWFSIDKGDNDPVEFLVYMISGIQGVHGNFGNSALKLLKSPSKPGYKSVVDLLINEMLSICEDFILVLDDFHLIENKEVLEMLSYFLEYIPSKIHLAVLTRSDPALPVARLRSQHQLLELRSLDLGFSVNDISILFNKKLKFGLSIEDVCALETKTEGWIAGLQLIALSMEGRENISAFIQDFKGDNRYIMDYLIEEVLKVQTNELKDFLLQTSILEQISGPLCNHVLNRTDSQFILEKLERNNMFVIPLDTGRNWYRYHHLFAQLLKQRLLTGDKKDLVELHRKASDWFKEQAMPLLAVEHAIEAGDLENGICLLGGIMESLWKNGQHSVIMKYGDQLPETLVKKNADFCLYYAWILIIAGQIERAGAFLVSAEEITKGIMEEQHLSTEEIGDKKKLLGKISVAFAYLNLIIGDSGKIFDYCKIAMDNLSEEDPLWFSWGWFSIGNAEMLRENFKGSIHAYEKALDYGKKSGNVYLISTIAINLAYLESRMGLYRSSYQKCSDTLAFMKENGYTQITKSESTFAGLYSCLAGIECMRTQFDDAFENIKTAYHLCKNESNNSFKVVVLLVYSLILYGRCNMLGLVKLLDEVEEIIKHHKIANGATSIYIAMKGFMLLEQNELQRASCFFKDNGMDPDKRISYLDEHGYSPYVLLLIEQSKYGNAEALLSKLLKMALDENRIERIIELKVIFAILYKAIGNRDKAVTSLIESMEYAANDHILMSFILFYNRISDLLPEMYKRQASSRTKIPKSLIDKLKSTIEKREKLKKTDCKADIRARESEIILLMAENFTNQEIADKLFISLNTVKTHLKNIFLKLGVDSRSQAVSKAKEFGLI